MGIGTVNYRHLCLLIIGLVSLNLHAQDHITFSFKLSECKPEIAPILVARDSGILKKYNIVLDEKASDQDADFFIAGRKEIYALEAAHKNQFKAFMGSFMDETHTQYAIIVNKESSIKSLADLENKKIVLESSSGGARFKLIEEIFKKNKINKKLVKIDSKPLPSIAKDLDQAIYVREPELSILMSSGNYRVIADEPVLGTFFAPWPMAYGVISNSFLKKNEGASKRLIAAMEESIELIRRDPEYTSSLISKCFHRNGHSNNLRLKPIAFWKSSEFDTKKIQKQIDLYYELQLMKRKIKTTDFLLP